MRRGPHRELVVELSLLIQYVIDHSVRFGDIRAPVVRSPEATRLCRRRSFRTELSLSGDRVAIGSERTATGYPHNRASQLHTQFNEAEHPFTEKGA